MMTEQAKAGGMIVAGIIFICLGVYFLIGWSGVLILIGLILLTVGSRLDRITRDASYEELYDAKPTDEDE
jgi:uncharacterized oligopeptide transporter (OPT) family protein